MIRVQLTVEVDGTKVELEYCPPRPAPGLTLVARSVALGLVDQAAKDARTWLGVQGTQPARPAAAPGEWVDR